MNMMKIAVQRIHMEEGRYDGMFGEDATSATDETTLEIVAIRIGSLNALLYYHIVFLGPHLFDERSNKCNRKL